MTSIRKKICLAAAFILVLLTGCANEADSYPVMEPIDSSTVALEHAEYDTLKLSFPADGWTIIDGEFLAITYDETSGTDSDVNITTQVVGKFPGKLSNKYRDNLAKAMEKNPGYLTLELMEVRSLHGAPVIYCEATAAFTEEGLDALLKAKAITEENIEAMGGREALLSIPPSYQVTMYAVIDKQLVIYTGTYYEEAQKQPVIDALTVMITTSDISPSK